MNSSKLIQRWIFASCLFLSLPALLYAQLSLDAEIRPRTEFRNGYRTLHTVDTDPAFFTSQRSRLNLRYQTDLYKIKISGQDVRVWGDVEQLQSNANVNIHEAWAELMLSEYIDLKFGRQELIYEDQRLLGSVNWTQQARSHDAILLRYNDTNSKFKIDIGGAYNQESERLAGSSYSLNNYKVLSYIWLNKKFEILNISGIGLTDGFEQQSGSTNFRYTYGIHAESIVDDLIFIGSVYLQNGDDALRENISAVMYAAKAGYIFNSLQLTAGYDYLSGGSTADNNPERHAFNTLYATNHKFYGHMDYFLNIPLHTKAGGLQDLYLQAKYDLTDNTNIELTYHNFSLAESVADPVTPGQSLGKNLGSELDFNMTHRFGLEIVFKIGYSLLGPSNSLEQIQQVDAKASQHWGWMMLSLTLTFLN